jgi:NADH:ubiquinone oxidoreductase subunit K
LLSSLLAAALTALVWFPFFRLLRSRTGEGMAGADLLLLSLTGSAALVSVAGLTLAFAGLFTLPLLSGVLCAAGAALWFLSRGGGDSTGAVASPPGRRLPSALLVAAAFMLFFRPHGNIGGKWDPGVYLAQGSALARGGDLRLADTASPLLSVEEKEAIYPYQRGFRVKYPGFFVSSRKDHSLDPQFYPLYPVWVGLFTLFGGFPSAFFLSGLFSFLSLLLLLRVGRELAGEGGAFAAGLLFLLNPFQIWFSGFPTAEVPMQTFFLGGLLAWLLYRRSGRDLLALLAGLFFALTAFASVTGFLLAALMALLHLAGIPGRRGAAAFLLPCILLLPLSLWQNLFLTSQYASQVQAIVPALRGLAPVAAAAAVAGAIFFYAFRRTAGDGAEGAEGTEGVPPRRGISVHLFGAGFVILATAAALYTGDFEASRLYLAAALTSKSSVLLAVAGFFLLLRHRPGVALPLGILAVVFTALFSGRLMMVSYFPWAAKRFLVVTVPLVCLGAGILWGKALAVPGKKPLKVLLVLLLILVSARPLYRGRDFAFHRDRTGLPAFVEGMAETLPADAVVLAPRWLGPPLEFIHGRLVVPIARSGIGNWEDSSYPSLVARLKGEGRRVFVAADEETTALIPLPSVPVFRERFPTTVLEQSSRPPAGRVRDKAVTVEVVEIR